jgi:hypothetical protein
MNRPKISLEFFDEDFCFIGCDTKMGESHAHYVRIYDSMSLRYPRSAPMFARKDLRGR